MRTSYLFQPRKTYLHTPSPLLHFPLPHTQSPQGLQFPQPETPPRRDEGTKRADSQTDGGATETVPDDALVRLVSTIASTIATALAQLRTLARLEDGEGEPGDGGGDELRDGGEDVEDAEVDAGHVAGGGRGGVLVVVDDVGAVGGGFEGLAVCGWVCVLLREGAVVVVGELVHFEGAVLGEASVCLGVGCGRSELVDLHAHDG